MAMTTYPLNNILYQAEDAELFHCTRTSGVYDNLDFQYSVTGADNNVTIGKGLAWIRNAEFAGKVSANKQPLVLDLGLTAKVFPRIDAIVIQFDANKNATSIIVKKGEEASKPQPPKVVRTEGTYELHLYHVLRNPSDATITEGVITDLRTNYDYCGIMLDDISRIDQTLTKDGFAADSGVVGRKFVEKFDKKLMETYIAKIGSETLGNIYWRWFKFEDGDAFAFGKRRWSANWTAWGSLFITEPKLDATSFPRNLFTEGPTTNVTVEADNQSCLGPWIEGTAAEGGIGKIGAMQYTSSAPTGTFTANFFLTGRWK